uniref:Fucolectin tachylectin-4 pentraxin-1 domain-containing protein n=1 Tax=Biomphalaria glabrata TaxID=6526 RepID=A0A2C9L804_BIOGL
MLSYQCFASIALVFMLAEIVLTAPFGDTCRLSDIGAVTNATSDGKPILYKTVPEECLEGQFDWDWPQGYVYLSSKMSRPHSLCIETTMFGSVMVGGISDVTDGAAKILELPTLDHPACTVATTGKTELRIQAESHQLYWTTFGYRVNLL